MTSPRRARTKMLSAIVIFSAPGTVERTVIMYVGVVMRKSRIFCPREMKETLNKKNVNLLIFVWRTALELG